MASHSSTPAQKISQTEELGRLQSMGSLRVRQDWATSLSCIGGGSGNPLQCSCLENPRDGGAWWAAVYGVSQSQRRLKRLSSSSMISAIPVLQLLLHQIKKAPIYSQVAKSYCCCCFNQELMLNFITKSSFSPFNASANYTESSM